MRLKTLNPRLAPGLILAVAAALALSGCGPAAKPAGAPADATANPSGAAAAPAAEGPTYDGVGVATFKDDTVTIDSEAVPAAGLAAGRHDFHTYADVMAEAPAGDGARVAFSFRKSGPGYDLTALKAR